MIPLSFKLLLIDPVSYVVVTQVSSSSMMVFILSVILFCNVTSSENVFRYC